MSLVQPLFAPETLSPQSEKTSQFGTPRSISVINHLRMVALQCRALPQQNMVHACAMLALDGGEAMQAHARVLMRSLPQAMNKRPILRAPGNTDYSFDETWLMGLIEALERDDDDSFVFLIKSRIDPIAQRNMAFLIRAISDRFSQV